MNALLAKVLGILNGLLALLIIFIFTLAGIYSADESTANIFYWMIWMAAGLLVATLICGLIAVFISINKGIEELNEGVEDLNKGIEDLNEKIEDIFYE